MRRIRRKGPERRAILRLSGACFSALLALAACGGSDGVPSVAYELVTVGNPGNADDVTGFGGVPYVYRIGTYSVTIGQYAAFLNAVAEEDKYSLYDSAMTTDLNSAGIRREGTPSRYTYVVLDNGGSSAKRPITYVTWFDAARFANWMSNGQPEGRQDDSTTEDGAYALHGTASGIAIVRNIVNPNTGSAPEFWIPLEDEWYKAAYYSPALDDGGYWLYPTQSNAAPGNLVGDGANRANYFTTVFSVTQSPDYLAMTQNYLTDVGAFSSSASFYGTLDQGGNVWQWNDLDGTAVPYRGIRGGYWFSGSAPLQSVLYSTDAPTRVENGLGFRLASLGAVQ